jgi:Secretion system C-terminal sorting domain
LGIETSGVSYAWEKDGKALANLKTATVQVSEKGIYRLRYGRRDCSVLSNAIQIYNKNVSSNISPLDTTFCLNGSVDLKTINDADAKYQWLKDGKEISAATTSLLKVSEIGKYQLLVKKFDCNTPSAEANVKQKPMATAILTGDKSINFGDSTKISVALSSDSPWTVKLSDNKTYSAIKTPLEITVKPITTTTYSLAEVKNICGVGTVSGTAKIDIIILGTENETGVNVEIFPIPTSEICHWKIVCDKPSATKLVIFDVSGKREIEQNFTDKLQTREGSLDIKALQAGTYILKIEIGDKILTRKIVKY